MGTGGRLDAPDDSSLAVDLERLDRRRAGTSEFAGLMFIMSI